MRIAIVASQWISVPPKAGGFGAQEYLAYHLARGLQKRGHDITLFASGDSTREFRLISVSDKQVKDIPANAVNIKETYELLALTRAYQMAGEFDLIHNHLLPYGLLFAPLTKTPTVHTLHHRIYPDRPEYAIYEAHKNQKFVSISEAQRKIVPDLQYIATVYNGIDLDYFKFKAEVDTDSYLLMIGRMKPYKGFHTAINLARELGLKLKIAAPKPTPSQSDYQEVMKYWETKIKPNIGETVSYGDEMQGEEKVKLYQNAKALLFPVERPEPFGMTVIEAMAAGTPVIAYSQGALPELIIDKETGFLVERNEQGYQKLAAAVSNLYQMDKEAYNKMREACRKRVLENFSLEQMVDGYEKIYKKIIV